MDKIKTDRLTIRPYRKADGDFVVSALNNLDVSRWLSAVPHPFEVADLKILGPDGQSRWPNLAAIEDESGMIGGIGGGEQLGYWLTPNAHGKGYGSEAAKAMVHYSFAKTATDRIVSGYFLGNQASKRILTNLGFAVFQEKLAMCKALGKELPVVKLELTRAQWEARQ